MKGRARAVAIALALAHARPAAAQTEPTPGPYGVEQTWTSRDKLYHFALSAAGAGAVYAGARWLGLKRWPAVGVSVAVVGAAGVVRELSDRGRQGKYFSEKDLVWNAAGITIGIWVTDRWLLRRD